MLNSFTNLFAVHAANDDSSGILALVCFPLWCLLGLVGIALFIFWIWMLVDCLQRDFKDKVLWVVLLLGGWFLGVAPIAAIIYYFLVKRPNI